MVVLDDFSTGRRENLAQWQADPRVTIVEANISDGLSAPLASLTAEKGTFDCIVHLAAQTSVEWSVQNALDDIQVNYVGTAQVLEYARIAGVGKVVFASSSAVYDENVPVPTREDEACQPLSPYGIDKFGAELFLKYYADVHGLRSTILRFFNVFGPRQDPGSPYSGVISIFAERAAAGQPLVIYGDGNQTRDFVFVSDVARAIVTACDPDRATGAILNIGTTLETSINELAHLIVNLSGSSAPITYEAPRAGELRRSAAVIDRAREALGFEPTVSLRDGLAITLGWAQDGVQSEAV